MSREHEPDEQTLGGEPTPEELDEILHRMGKFRPEDLLNCGACGYEGCLEHARAVYAGWADSDMCLPHTIEQLREAYGELEVSHRSLEEAKEALERSGKLASMGQLAAGIAHEVNNPLGTLLLHANLLLEECEPELRRQRRPGDHRRPGQPLQAHHLRPAELLPTEPGAPPAHRRGRVGRARPSAPPPSPTRSRSTLDNELADPIADIDPDQMVQVFTNLFTNAQQAMPDGGTLAIDLQRRPDTVTIKVTDTGVGIARRTHAQPVRPLLQHQTAGHGHRAWVSR